MVNDPEGTKRLEVYELDLETWVWRRVDPLGTQPSCRRATSAVVIQVSPFRDWSDDYPATFIIMQHDVTNGACRVLEESQLWDQPLSHVRLGHRDFGALLM